MHIADYFILIVSIIIIGISLLTSSKEDAQQAFTGSSSELFKTRKMQGFELFVTRVMIVGSVLFFVFIFWSNSIDRLF